MSLFTCVCVLGAVEESAGFRIKTQKARNTGTLNNDLVTIAELPPCLLWNTSVGVSNSLKANIANHVSFSRAFGIEQVFFPLQE